MRGIAERWQKKVSKLHEYAVVKDGNLFRAGLENSFLFQSEYQAALEMGDRLAGEYSGVPLDSVFSGRCEETPCGESYCIETYMEATPPAIDSGTLSESLLSRLTLIHGIGPAMERRLKGRGYRTIQDLLHHPLYRRAAAAILHKIEAREAGSLEELTRERLPRSHPLVLKTSLVLEPEKLVFLDIETLGLFTRPVILIGIGRMERNGIRVAQYLIRDPSEEPAALWSFRRRLEGACDAFVTFNGRSFDIPYIMERLAYYGIQAGFMCPHYDLLQFSRRRWKGLLNDTRLRTLERKILGFERRDDIPSQLVPEFYEMYLRTGNCGPLIPIVMHNREDIRSLFRLYSCLAGEDAWP
ncbi:MAG: ribonuclease H-like domain-containing protein [Methanomicrobiales archaeon]|nr:ribonuclease H-like domain-containing protein [Methanomicrobiales archaeon]